MMVGGVSCTKPSEPSTLALVGTWNWIESVGGIGGWRWTPQSEGYTKKIKFTLPNVVQEFRNNEMIFEGMYRVEKKSYGENKAVDVLIIPSRIEQMIFYKSADTLILSEYCADCWQKTYVRVR